MPRQQRELLRARWQIIGQARERHLQNEQNHDQSVEDLGKVSPTMLRVAHCHVGKLMRLTAPWKLPLALPVFLALLSGCPLPPRAPRPAPPPAVPSAPAPHVGTPYEILPQSSLLTILVYRGGALASAGHNHVIASHDLSGTIYVPPELLQSSFEVHVPVATLTVDEAALRAQQPAAEFPADVSESAKEGTRRNMLGEA